MKEQNPVITGDQFESTLNIIGRNADYITEAHYKEPEENGKGGINRVLCFHV